MTAKKSKTVTPYQVLSDRIQKRCMEKRRPEKEIAGLLMSDATVGLRDASEFRAYTDKLLLWCAGEEKIFTEDDHREMLRPITDYCNHRSLHEAEIKCTANIYINPALHAAMHEEDKDAIEGAFVEAADDTTDNTLRHYAKKVLLKLYIFDMARLLTAPGSQAEFLEKMFRDKVDMTEEAYRYYNKKFGGDRLLPCA